MGASDPLGALRRAPGVIRLHGHRGARGIFPENTMAGYRFVLECGLKAMEFDVLFARDGTPVLTHNGRLSPDAVRDADGNWISAPGPVVHGFSVEELRRFDVGGLRDGSLYASRFPEQAVLTGERIPLLDDLAALVSQPEHGDVWLNLEIKSNPHHPDETPPIPELVAATLEVITRHGLEKRTLLQCFDWRVLQEIAVQAPGMARSFLSTIAEPETREEDNIYPNSPWMAGLALEDYAGSLPRLVAEAGGQVWSPYFRDLTQGDLNDAHDLGLIVNVWTVNEPHHIDRMIELGVDGIITDYPGRAQRRLVAHGLDWLTR